ncbi:MAG TPA: alpha/beta hydrolase domain-containing protein [Solirubrobacteraceae bacterium]|nr:alpha/beta hydrolase domain-containing protein [Solirubrobacteraceae bacterium]
MHLAALRARRGGLIAAFCVAAVALFALASPALSAPYENVPTPTVEGPIPVTAKSHPFLATDIPLANYGYTEEEYFISGTGSTYNTTGAINVTGTKLTTGGPNGNGTYPFKTRIVVRRPTDPAKFNGKVIVEWNNVTAGYDLEANWFGDPYYLLKHGYAYVTVSAQNVGVNYLKTKFSPERYGSLEVGPSGDALSFDIFGAAVKAVRGLGVGPEPLGNLTPNITKVTASGESQSCGRLVTYFNKIAPIHQIVDDYLLTVCTTEIRSDRPEKALRIITEFENKEEQKEAEAPANPSLRHWEAAGASHVPFLAVANWTVPVDRDTGVQTAICTSPPLSKVSWPYLVNIGTQELNEWQEGGPPPPLAPRGEYESPKVLKRDALGNAKGGIRLPEMDVPTGVNRGDNSAAPPPNSGNASAFCTLLGQYKPFSEETLEGLYTDYGDYVDKVKADTEKLVTEGFLLPEDGLRLIERAEEFPRLRPTVPVLSGGSSPNKGSFQLSWRGPVPSHSQAEVPNLVKTKPTFEVQHRPAAGGEWTTVATGLESTSYSPTEEQEGTWNYRVRSRTVVPAFKAEPEMVYVTPYSEEIGNIVVDRTGPNPPTATPDRAPDYAGGGGWYKDTVTVSFTDNGDPLLADGSPGTGTNPATLSGPQTFSTDGAHTASGTEADNVGNVSAPGTLLVQVDVSAPSLKVNCPSTTPVGSSASATITASDGQSGLASDPSGSVPIDTSEEGPQTTEATATDNVGHSTTASCTTQVVNTNVITGKVKGKLVVKSGESVKLTSTAKANAIEVQPGGSLDVEGATVKGVKASKAGVIRICGAKAGSIKVSGSTGPVVLGDSEGCAGSSYSAGASITNNTGGVSVVGDAFKGSVKVTGNSGGTTVTGNTVGKNLTVTGNSGAVVDQPNTVGGKTKVQ